MEGALYFPPDRPKRRPEQACLECGRSFRPRQSGEGAQVLCDDCYQKQFAPRRAHGWQRSQGRPRATR